MTNIAIFRRKAGLKQTELAEEIGLSNITLSRYESGERQPRAEDIKKICAALHCTPNDLLGVETKK